MSGRSLSQIIPARAGTWLVLSLILLTVLAIRWHLREMPLERDEGEYAYAGQLLLQGISPYDHAYNIALKLPGTTLGYAAIMAVLGQTAAGIHTGMIPINLATIALVFLLIRRMFGDGAGLAGAATFGLLSILPPILGLAAHATHFVMLPALAGILLLQPLGKDTSLRRIFGAGLFLGLAIVMKQSALPFGLFAAIWLCHFEFLCPEKNPRRWIMRLLCLALGGLLPLLLTSLIIAAFGDFGSFWFWTFEYAWNHGTILGFQGALMTMCESVLLQFMSAPALWILSLLGLVLVFLPRFRAWRFFVWSLFICSFLAVAIGGYFRGHYFIQLLPAAAIGMGITFRALADFAATRGGVFKALPGAVIACAACATLLQWCDVYFLATPPQASRLIYGTNPFAEAVDISRYIAAHSQTGDTIAILGSEPEIYFYSRRHSASGYICTYPLVEPQPDALAMQGRMIAEIERARPAYVLFMNLRGSWRQSNASVTNTLPVWWNGHAQGFQLIGAVDIAEDQPSAFFWDDQLAARTNTDSPSISIFRRK